MIIAVEGIDGAGKSTHITDLYYQLNQLSNNPDPPKPSDSINETQPTSILPNPKPRVNIQLFHQPGATAYGDEIRKIVKNGNIKAGRYAQFYSFLSQWHQLCEEKIKPIIESTPWNSRLILLDRCPPVSAYSYSVSSYGISHLDYVNAYGHYALRDCNPNIILLFEADIQLTLKRLSKRPDENHNLPDRFENSENLIKAIKGYKEVIHGGLFSEDTYIRIDASPEKKYVYYDVVRQLLAHPAITGHKIVPMLQTILDKKV